MGVIDLVYPRRCLGCNQTGDYFCAECLNELVLSKETICPGCGNFAAGGVVHVGCKQVTSLAGEWSVFRYQGLIKKAIKQLKYRLVTDVALSLVEAVVSFAGENKTFSDYCRKERPWLCPVPLHHDKERWRGFNQAEVVGQKIAQSWGLEFVPEALVRVKKTEAQFELDKNKRAANLRGAFEIKPKYQGVEANYLLFDDVWTTGATLGEAAKVLRIAGGKKVWGLTIAR